MLLASIQPPLVDWIHQNMHIPDGYLAPAFAIGLLVVALVWLAVDIRAFGRQLNQRMVPLVALFAAFVFVIMMFNVPLIGGTTGHAIGATIAAIVLGPAGAALAVSIALLIQALFFGDGGILAWGANVLLMALIMSHVAYFIYNALSGSAPIQSGRRIVAAFVAGWASLSLIAGLAGVLLGLQPILFRAADGTPLYAPFPLTISVPAMLIPHMLVASVIEGLAAAGIVWFLQRSNPALLSMGAPSAAGGVAGATRWQPLAILLAVLVVLSPLGLLAGGAAWGEWATDEIEQMVGYVPAGMQATTAWSAPLPDYGIAGLSPTAAYILSALIGCLLVGLAVGFIGRFIARRPAPVEQARAVETKK